MMRAVLAVIVLLGPVSKARAQTTQEDLPTDTARPYDPSYPFLPESDPLIGVPELDVPPPTILDDTKAFFEWEERGFSPSKTPADYDPVESMTLPGTTPNLPLPETPTANEEEMQIRDKEREAFENVFKSSRILGLYRNPVSGVLPFVPEPRIVFEKEKARRLKLGPVRTAFEAAGTFNFTNNVFGANRDTKSDTFTTFQPRFYVESGTRGFVSLLYMPNFTRYSTYRYLDNRDENIIFNLRYPFSKLEVAVDLLYLTQSGLFVNSQGYSEARSYLARVFANYPITRKIDLFMSYEGRNDKADPGGIAIDHSVTLSARYRHSQAISYGGSYQIGRVDADFGEQFYQTFQLLGAIRPSYHFKLEGRGGFQVRRFSHEVAGRDGLVAPVFDITGSYHWNDNTAFVLRLYRSISTVTFDHLHLDIETGLESYALVRFFGNTDIKMQVAGGYGERMANVAPKTGDFCFLQGGLSVSWAVSKMWELILFNNTQQRFADSSGANFISNVTGVGCKLRF